MKIIRQEKVKGALFDRIIDEIKPWLQSAMDLSNSEYIFPHENGKEPMGRSGPTDTPYNFMQFARKNYKIEMDHWSMNYLRRTARTKFQCVYK